MFTTKILNMDATSDDSNQQKQQTQQIPESSINVNTQTQLQPNTTSQDLTISTNNELHWCPDMDYQLSCDNMYRSGMLKMSTNNNSQISFTLASNGAGGVGDSIDGQCQRPFLMMSNGNNNNNNFDIRLAQIDIETFKSEDIIKINRLNHPSMLMSNDDDTLRIVDSINSLPPPPGDDNCEALSIDSLDLSMDNSINSELIQKCSQNIDKTKYKIAMIDTSVHSSNMNNSMNNPFSDSIQSPGSLVKMFIQNRQMMTNSSSSDVKNNNPNHHHDLSKFDNSNTSNNNNNNNPNTTSFTTTDDSQSLNTIDSNELPLHVLDLSKKLRSALNISNSQKQSNHKSNNNSNKYLCSTTSMSSNTSFTSTTTTTSSSTTDRHHHHHRHKHHRHHRHSTNPFLDNNLDDDDDGNSNDHHPKKSTKSAGTQFPDLFQDKQIQASPESPQAAPVLVYYPNYSLPDLSFLQEIFQQDPVPVYLSPVKHEPAKPKPEVRRRVHPDPEQRKIRPKSYTDYEALLNQDLSHIKDWDSLNLLLPDDFKEFIKQNNLLQLNIRKNQQQSSAEEDHETKKPRSTSNIPLAHKAMFPLNNQNHRLFQNVKMRQHSADVYSQNNKRYSLQEHQFVVQQQQQPQQQNYPNYLNSHNRHQDYEDNGNVPSFMIRSQTMPNCQLMPLAAAAGGGGAGFVAPPVPPRLPPNSHYHHYHHHPMHHHAAPVGCCGMGPPLPPPHPAPCCHSGCHSPSSSQSSQTSPLKPNFIGNNSNCNNLEELLSSSSSFKKLLSFLSKLDEYSSQSNSTATMTAATTDTVTGQQSNELLSKQKAVDNLPSQQQQQRVAITPNQTNSNGERQHSSRSHNQQQQQHSRHHRSSNNHHHRNSSKNDNGQLTSTKNVNHHHSTSSSSKTASIIQNRRMVNNSSSSDSKQQQPPTKIILKRPTTLNKNLQHQNNSGSGIPVPKRMSSMIPVFKNGMAIAGGGTGNPQPNPNRHYRNKHGNNNHRY